MSLFTDNALANRGACVHTLKIEGRGRSPEYVKLVTQAYRRAVDAVQNGSYCYAFAATLLDDIKEVYNRGHSDGYYLGREQGWSNSSGSKATQQNVLRGQVTHYYAQIGVAEITVTSGSPQVSDQYVIIGETSGVVEGTIESLRLVERDVAQVSANEVCAIKVSQRVRCNDKFFIIVPVASKTTQAS